MGPAPFAAHRGSLSLHFLLNPRPLKRRSRFRSSLGFLDFTVLLALLGIAFPSLGSNISLLRNGTLIFVNPRICLTLDEKSKDVCHLSVYGELHLARAEVSWILFLSVDKPLTSR